MNTYITPVATLPSSSSPALFLLTSADFRGVLALYGGVLIGSLTIIAVCLLALTVIPGTSKTASSTASIQDFSPDVSEVPLLPARQSHTSTLTQF